MTAPAVPPAAAGAEPWLARPDWARRQIGDGARSGMWFLLCFAIGWNAIGWTVALAVFRPTGTAPLTPRLLVLLFPAAGVALAVGAVRAVLRYLRYGASVLELATLPAPPGRLLAGVVETRGIIAPESGFRVRLSCFRVRITGAGKNRSTTEQLLWQDERTIPGATRRGPGIGIPFAIPLPADARETDERDRRDRTVWRLSVDADVPGIDYSATFEVPVFRTADSATPLTEAELQALDPADVPEAQGLSPGSPVSLVRTLHGLDLSFPAGHPPTGAWGLVGFTLLWTGAIGLMLSVGAPWVFPLVFGLFEVLLILGVVQFFLLGSTVRADGSGLVLSRAIAGVPLADVAVPRGAITRLEPELGFQAGASAAWDLAVWRPDGRKLILGRTIPTRREAEWLAKQLRQTLSLAP